MIRVIAVLMVMLVGNNVLAQDTTYSKNPVYPSTEVLVAEIIESLQHSPIDKNDSLIYFLGKWESIARRNEAAERVKILRDISKNQFDKSNYQYYYKYFIAEFLYRAYCSNKENYQLLYDSRKDFFNYVPLNSEFDSWTKSIAEKLLPKLSYGSDQYLICLLLSNQIDSFDDELRSKKYNTSTIKNTYLKSHRIFRKSEGFYKLYVGQWLPIGKLSRDFKPNLNLGFSFGFPVKLNYRVEGRLQMAVFPGKSELEFKFDDSRYKTKKLKIVSGGFRFTYEHKINKELFFDTSAEININAISTDIKNPNGENQNSTYGVETIDLGIGVGIKKFVGERNAIGIESFLHAAPYNLNNKLLSNIGFLFLSSSVFYSF